ncbi:MAG TPA: fibronectin type III domain-containing protein [Bryobacteraceae bacterium]|nr:fibronectin type III domain-containing protein [Bryobacteraceae bacterium]
MDNPEPLTSAPAHEAVSAAADTPNQVTVEIVNDSGLSDDVVFVLLSTPQPGNLVVTGPSTLISNVNSKGVTLSSLGAVAGATVTSPFTGKPHPVYSFVIQNVVAGQVNFSYNTAVEFKNGAAPTENENYRFDKMEISYNSAGKAGGGNLTSIDFYGIPLQVEVFHASDLTTADPLQTKSFYASTPTLLQMLAGLSTDMSSGTGWIRSVDGAAFAPRNPDFSKFLRILSPKTIAAADIAKNSSAPYPSFEAYLTSLVGTTIQVNGAQNGGYHYTGVVQKDGNDGFDVVCTGTTTAAPPDPPSQLPKLSKDAKVTIHFPKGQPGKSMDFFIYGCVPNRDSYTIDGYPFTGNNVQEKVDYVNGTAYGSLVGDIQAALNFGYPNSRFVAPGGDIDALYGTVVLPYPYPFGGAPVQNDGFYNPYAALIYYLSDAYGHPFSDRLDASSPLYALTAGDKIRITILPDIRLDAPLVQVAGQTDHTLTLTWKSVQGATGYTIGLVPPPTPDLPIAIAAVDGDIQTHTVTGLSPGIPYVVSVTAIGPANTTSNQLPVQGMTSGTRVPLNQGPIEFQLGLNLPPSLPNFSDLKVLINGSPARPTTVVAADFGVNAVGLAIQSTSSGAVLYQGNYLLEFVSQNGGANFGFGPTFELQNNRTPLTRSGDSFRIGDKSLVVGTPFTPKPFYFFATVVPTKPGAGGGTVAAAKPFNGTTRAPDFARPDPNDPHNPPHPYET